MKEIEFPGGYLREDGVLFDRAIVRPLTGEEEDILTSRRLSYVTRFNMVFTNCIQELSSGTEKIELKTEVAKAVPKLTIGDRVFLLFVLRQISIGDEFDFDIQCPECNRKLEKRVYLSQLKVFPMPDKRKRVFEEQLPSGVKCKWQVMTGELEEKMERMRSEKDALSLAIFVRLVEFDGREPTLYDVKSLVLSDRNYLRQRFDENEGGVETDILVDCKYCGAQFTTMLDIGQTSFFFPGLRRR